MNNSGFLPEKHVLVPDHHSASACRCREFAKNSYPHITLARAFWPGFFLHGSHRIRSCKILRIQYKEKTQDTLWCRIRDALMKPPKIPPMLSTIIQAGLLVADGAEFDRLSACPDCGGPVSGYDTRKRLFVTIRENETERDVFVQVKRFKCTGCGRVVYADSPFYPATRIGSPVIDLCVTLSATMPVNRVAAYLDTLDVIVDRTSCRLWVKNTKPDVPATDLFGVRLPLSVISLSSLGSRYLERGPVPGAEILVACGFPSAHRTAPDRAVTKKEGEEREAEK